MGDPVDRSGHITQTVIRDLASGRLERDELAAAAEHIAGCEQCALALAEAIEAEKAAVVPAGFDEEVINRVSNPRGKRMELTFFSIRVALAAGIALFFIFFSAWGSLPSSFSRIEAPDFSAVENINVQLQQFSEQILDMEVFQNVQETK